MQRMLMTLAVLALALLPSAPAFAHAFLLHADPPVGSTIAAAPGRLRLEFTEPVEPALSGVTLEDPAGKSVALGALQTAPGNRAIVLVPIAAKLAPGTYRVHWHVVAVDTHRTEGDFSFTLKP